MSATGGIALRRRRARGGTAVLARGGGARGRGPRSAGDGGARRGPSGRVRRQRDRRASQSSRSAARTAPILASMALSTMWTGARTASGGTAARHSGHSRFVASHRTRHSPQAAWPHGWQWHAAMTPEQMQHS